MIEIKSDLRDHWERVFTEKDTTRVSWFQEEPIESLELIEKLVPNHESRIIDIGGGDSNLPDLLLSSGYNDVSVVDISKQALQNSQTRLGSEASKIKWIESNILNLNVDRPFDLWYDRAVFHFITAKQDQLLYKKVLLKHLAKDGISVLAGFSTNNGPTRCSGLEVCQLDENRVRYLFGSELDIISQYEKIHTTPSGGEQNFYWAILKKTNQ